MKSISWRIRNYRPVPNYALQTVLDYLFEIKLHNAESFSIAISEGIKNIKKETCKLENNDDN